MDAVVAGHQKVNASATASAQAQVSAIMKVKETAEDAFTRKKWLDEEQAVKAKQLADAFVADNKVTLDKTERDYVQSLYRKQAALLDSSQKSAGKDYEVWKRANADLVQLADHLDKARETYAAREVARQHHVAATAIEVGNQVARSGIRAALEGSGIPLPALAGGAALAAGVVTSAAITQVKQAVAGYLELGDATHKLTIETGGSANAMSTMIAVAARYGVTSSDLMMIMNRLKTVMVSTPQEFERLGIATKNADGSLRSVADVFADLRSKLANARQDANTMQTATELLGRSAYELLPYLTASDAEIKKYGDSVQGTARVMDEKGVAAAKRYQQQLRELGAEIQNAKNWLGQAALNLAEDVITIGKATQIMYSYHQENGQTVRGPLPTDQGSSRVDAGLGAGGAGPASEVQRDELQNRSLAAQNHKAAVDEINEELTAKRDALTEENRLISEEMKLHQEAGAARLKAIGEEHTAWQRAHEDKLRAINEEHTQYTKDHQEQLRVINEEHAARNEAAQDELDAMTRLDQAAQRSDTHRTQAHQDEIKVLRDRIAVLDEAYAKEQQADALEAAQKTLNHLQHVEIYRTKSETEEAYNARVFQHSTQLKDAEKRLTDENEKITRDATKKKLDDQIKAIETTMEAERRAAEKFREQEQDKQQLIRDRMKADNEAVQARVKDLEKQMRTEANQHETLIKQLEAEALKVNRNHEDAVKAINDEDAAFHRTHQAQLDLNNEMLRIADKNAKARLKAETDAFDGTARESTKAATSMMTDLRRIRDEADTTTDRLKQVKIPGGLGGPGANGHLPDQNVNDQNGSGDKPVTNINDANLNDIYAHWAAKGMDPNADPNFLAFAKGLLKDNPHLTWEEVQGMADGGSVLMPEAGYLVGDSGRKYARSDPNEPVIFGGIGGKALGGGGGATVTVPVTIVGWDPDDVGRQVAARLRAWQDQQHRDAVGGARGRV